MFMIVVMFWFAYTIALKLTLIIMFITVTSLLIYKI